MGKEELLLNINKLHTTSMGISRIQKNLNISSSIVDFCKNKIKDNNCLVYHKGKNYYCYIDNIVITINANSYTIITAHIM